MTTGYVYNTDTNEIVAIINGEQSAIEQYVDNSFDTEINGLTYAPAFDTNDGLIKNDKQIVVNI